VAAKQARIKEAAQARLAVACECIEKKRKAKEEEARKAEEARKVEEEEEAEAERGGEQVVREKAWKRQLEVCLSTV